MPTDTTVITALRDATCAQVEWWQATQDEVGQYDLDHKVSVTIAGLRERSPGRRSKLAPRAFEILSAGAAAAYQGGGLMLTGGLMSRDAVTISRQSATVDAEGNAVDALSAVVYAGRAWGLPSAKDITLADTRGEVASALVAIPNGIVVRLDDVVDVRGSRYVVVGLNDVRICQQLVLRQVNF